MGKYKKCIMTDMPILKNGYYKDSVWKILKINSLTLFFNSNTHKTLYWSNYCVEGSIEISREEFKEQLILRRSKVWKALYGA